MEFNYNPDYIISRQHEIMELKQYLAREPPSPTFIVTALISVKNRANISSSVISLFITFLIRLLPASGAIVKPDFGSLDNMFKNSGLILSILKDGKEKVFGFFIGKIMQETKGKANPKIVNELLREKISHIKK